MKYNFDDLHWQEFETLAFKVLQKLISPGVQFLKGGNDKGRDVVYSGISDFNRSYAGDWIFQAKHKSKAYVGNELVRSLSSDLKQELEKVFLVNKLKSDIYVLVTNKELNADAFDILHKIFKNFKEKHRINCNHFDIINYQHIESCFDENEQLKWCYPNVISHPDFELLIQKAVTLHLENRRKGWLLSIQKQRERFVYTSFFQTAYDKLSEFTTIILSGPPKSGKTFNAEILALNLSIHHGFQPVLVESIEDMESAFKPELKQVFIFDDAFGKYSLSFDSKEWFSRLDHIFELANESHLFIFTSREYIFREFINYGNENARSFLEKIMVESHNYSKDEKLAMLLRYTQQSPLTEEEKGGILVRETFLTDHKNFSPETIRAFFFNINVDKGKSQLEKLIDHLDKPDKYLSAVFFSLPPIKQAVLLAVLCAVQNNMEVIKRTFGSVCRDLELNAIVNAFMEFDELDDSILRISNGESIETIRFYHPSMQEFLIRQIVNNNSIKLKEVVLKNLNNDLLALSQMMTGGKSIVGKIDMRDIHLSKGDVVLLRTGILRMAENGDTKLYQLTSAFAWFSIPQHTIDLKVTDNIYFKSANLLLNEFLIAVFADSFFFSHKSETCKTWANFLWQIKNSLSLYGVKPTDFDLNPLKGLLQQKKDQDHYWTLLFRSLYFLGDEMVMEIVDKNWLNKFYVDLRTQIDTLGKEIYGEDYPDFNEYNAMRKLGKEVEKVKVKPNKTWYPRFLFVEDQIEVLKGIKGTSIGKQILVRVIDRYDHIKGLKDYAKNRHQFIVGRGWWKNSNAQA